MARHTDGWEAIGNCNCLMCRDARLREGSTKPVDTSKISRFLNDVPMIQSASEAWARRIDAFYQRKLKETADNMLQCPAGEHMAYIKTVAYQGSKKQVLYLKLWQGVLRIRYMSYDDLRYNIVKHLICEKWSIWGAWDGKVFYDFRSEPAFGLHYTHVDVTKFLESTLCIGAFEYAKFGADMTIGEALAKCYETVNLCSVGGHCLPGYPRWAEIFEDFGSFSDAREAKEFCEALVDRGLLAPFWKPVLNREGGVKHEPDTVVPAAVAVEFVSS